ncbi:ABC transporter permease [Alicyclobacillus shizuokensis]|uniref:ABC transporter permease n=1 Tax=Alicyclobacillus shizuokensis TaxID=392014 RepID=UPI00082A2D1B|nr:ABC transporter permease [Alicyclobacillus shizuokensis]MCL6625237.1 ABC transporter permease [Alicyclobacillus shizuokensis]
MFKLVEQQVKRIISVPNKRLRWSIVRNNVYLPSVIASLVLLGLGQVISPGFADFNNIGNILAVASILAIAAVGQTMVIVSGGEGIDLSVGAVMSMGALLGASFIHGEASRLPIAVVLLVLIGAAIGYINGFGIQWVGIPPLVMTLIMTSVVNGFTVAYTKGQPSGAIPKVLLAVGQPIVGPIRWLLVLAIAILVAFGIIMNKTSYGKRLFLIGSNRNAALLSGISVRGTVTVTYMISGVIGALAGLILVGYTGNAQLQMASDYTLLSIAAVVIGGTKLAGGEGTLVGAALGAIVLTMLTSVLVAVGLPQGVRELVQGLTLLLILVAYSRAPRLRQ